MDMLNALSPDVRSKLVRAAAHCGGAAVCRPAPQPALDSLESELPAHPQRSLVSRKRSSIAGAQCL